ncbi:flagellar biosynthesis protein FlgF [Escherichia coli]|nr:flagellar biosynthesis protein FlgF [Escherichia coli]
MACRRAGQTAQAGRSRSDASRRFDVNVAEQPATVALSHPEASTSGAFLIYKINILRHSRRFFKCACKALLPAAP